MNLFKDLYDSVKEEKNSVKFWHSLGFMIQLSILIFVDFGLEWFTMIQFLLFLFTLSVVYDTKHNDDAPNHFAVQFIGTYILMLIGQICYWIYKLFKRPVMFFVNIIKNFNKMLDKK